MRALQYFEWNRKMSNFRFVFRTAETLEICMKCQWRNQYWILFVIYFFFFGFVFQVDFISYQIFLWYFMNHLKYAISMYLYRTMFSFLSCSLGLKTIILIPCGCEFQQHRGRLFIFLGRVKISNIQFREKEKVST